MNVRRTDENKGSGIVKITREIPLWGILTVVGTLGAQGVSTYYGQQKLAEQVSKLSDEVRALTLEVNKINVSQAGMQIQLTDAQRRLSILEDRVAAIYQAQPVPRR